LDELIGFANGDEDVAAASGCSDGVLQQVDQHLLQANRIAVDRRLQRHFRMNADAPVARHRPGDLERPCDDVVDSYELLANVDAAANDTRDVEQVVDD